MIAPAWLLARKATSLDTSRLISLLSIPAVASGYFGAPCVSALPERTLARNLAEADEGRGEVWVGCARGEAAILACAAVVEGRLAYLVDPAWQGQGLATSLARWACDRAFEARPGAPIGALAFRDNVASVAVLERLGFRFAGLSWPTIAGCYQPKAMLSYELTAPRRY